MHCHHHAVIKTTAERSVLDRMGLRYDVLPSGCCGMAGSFGFERDKYAVSTAAAERVLLPKVRAASPDTIILANGFSCREQIEQGSGRETLHIAEVIARFVYEDPDESTLLWFRRGCTTWRSVLSRSAPSALSSSSSTNGSIRNGCGS
jgi:hypothetical protein